MQLASLGNGVWVTDGARIIDRAGDRRLPIGRDGFVSAMRESTLVDKTMLIADVLDSSYAATLFCRPRRFGKTLNMTMLKAFLEATEAGGLRHEEAEALFDRTEVCEASSGSYRKYLGAYPVVHLTLSTAVGSSWEETHQALKGLIQTEFARHGYLGSSDKPLSTDTDLFRRIVGGSGSDADYAASLAVLCRMLRAHHGANVVLLIDEYDAPIMDAHSHQYYDRAVSFMRRWLTGAIKDGGMALAFACLTGVQRISRESIFSGLNNLHVSTSLNIQFDERYGFTDAEVEALATYLGHPECMAEARDWYDGYRFGRVDVYNPWSVLNYLYADCTPGTYWGNTSGNAVLGELVAKADADTLGNVYDLLEPGGTVEEPLDLGIVFPDLAIRGDAIWSMLYLAGYLTTDDTDDPGDDMRIRPLRIPDREVGRLFRNEVLRRFRAQAGGAQRLRGLHRALLEGDDTTLAGQLEKVALRASSLDLVSELACHMLVMGLLFGLPGYHDPTSNREAGYGRYDIRLKPDGSSAGARPLVTVEVKFSRDADRAALDQLAHEALDQIEDRGYDKELPSAARGRLRWGIAFSGKRVGAACMSL